VSEKTTGDVVASAEDAMNAQPELNVSLLGFRLTAKGATPVRQLGGAVRYLLFSVGTCLLILALQGTTRLGTLIERGWSIAREFALSLV
jgi:hypothetical protein